LECGGLTPLFDLPRRLFTEQISEIIPISKVELRRRQAAALQIETPQNL
jgi:hypothetical protein